MIVFFFADKYGVHCSVTWIAIAVFISAVVAIATPPIPGGGTVAYSILFLQLGIPKEALAIALALDVLADFLITAFDVLVLPMTLIQIASKLGMIDIEIVRG